VEALASPCEYSSVIKFLTIHLKTMEAYTLWWNDGTLWEILDYNTKYSPIMNNWTLLQQRVSNMKRQTWFIAFRWNHVKLVWAFINIMEFCTTCPKTTLCCIFH
jgi:hypothetical protein